MFPVYRCMDSFPHQRNQVPCTPHYHQNLEAVPPQMKVDPARSPITNEHWPYAGPYGGSYGFSYPVNSHGCCNHNYIPGYYGFRPSYPHFPPPSLLHCYGSCPAFPGTYPVHYMPPPHYSMEQPSYEYDMNMSRDHHCCGCPNHSCNQKEDRNVIIEEQDADVEKKGNDSLVPAEWKNTQYPVVRIPPGWNREHRKPIESESKESYDHPHYTKGRENLKSFEREPCVWNGWVPLDISSLGPLKQGGDGKRTQHQQNEDRTQFPFPIFWMPGKPEEVERKDHKATNTDEESVEESPSRFRISPVRLPDTNDRTSKPRASEENSGSDCGPKMMDKISVEKNTPVNQKEQHEEKTSEGVDKKSRGTTTVKQEDDSGRRKASENGAKGQSPSSPKTSKLPPVCLRIDPLPRRKNNDGSLRSPSPPTSKGKSQELSNEHSTSSTSSNVKEKTQQDMQSANSTLDKSKEVERSKRKTTTIEVVEGTNRKEINENMNKAQTQSSTNLPVDSREQVSTSQTISKSGTGSAAEDKKLTDAEDKSSGEEIEIEKATVEGQSGYGRCDIKENKGASKAREEKNDEANKVKRNKLSDAEAAVIIQSAYRGFEVRRWEPLKKLKQIAKISEQVAEIKACIQALSSSADLQSDDKQRVVIGETIMSLLLKLDTIQGLHPIIRNIRKSVARELVNLQEKLDSLTIKKSKASTAESMEDFSGITRDGVCVEGGKKEAQVIVGLDNHPPENDHDIDFNSVEPCQDHPLSMRDFVSDSQAVECEDKLSELACGADLNKVKVALLPESKDEENNGVHDVDRETVSNMLESYEDSELGRPVELPLPSVGKEKTNPEVEVTESSSSVDDKDVDTKKLVEFAQETFDKEPDFQESEKYEQTEKVIHAVTKCESNAMVDATSPDNEAAGVNHVGEQPKKSPKEGPITAELKDMPGSEKNEEKSEKLLDEATHEPDKLPASQEVRRVNELAEVSLVVEDKIGSEKDEDLTRNAGSELKEISVQPEGGPITAELKDMPGSEKDEDKSEELLEEATHEPDELPARLQEVSCVNELAEVSPVEEDKIGSEKDEDLTRNASSELKEITVQPEGEVTIIPESPTELSVVRNGIHDEHKEEHEMTDADDNPLGLRDMILVSKEKGYPVEECKEFCVDQSIPVGEEHVQLEQKHEFQEPELVTKNDNIDDHDQALVKIEFVVDDAKQAEEEELSPLSPTASQVSLQSDIKMENDRKLIEENEKLREMMEKLIEAGKEQLTAISSLSGRVKDLEKRLARKKKLKMRRNGASASGSLCLKPCNETLKESAVGLAV